MKHRGPWILAVWLLAAGPAAGWPQDHGFLTRPGKWTQPQARVLAPTVLAAGIFGDGNPANGPEDDRMALTSPAMRGRGWQPRAWSAGTVHCDGRARGSAMILDTSRFGPEPPGLVLLTAAHVLVNLDSARPYRSCRFHYMGLDRLPGYQAAIDLERTRSGAFDPRASRERPDFGREDWVFLYVPEPGPGAAHPGRITPRAFDSVGASQPSQDIRFRLVAYSEAHHAIGVSPDCRVLESIPGDLGGGAWRGQLLDDCDSGQGASGGGLVAIIGGVSYLVGIRTGAHWDPRVFPHDDFPAGPPAGSPWNIRENTNFARAVDGVMLSELRSYLRDIQAAGHGSRMY